MQAHQARSRSWGIVGEPDAGLKPLDQDENVPAHGRRVWRRPSSRESELSRRQVSRGMMQPNRQGLAPQSQNACGGQPTGRAPRICGAG
ncbi:hypothetical protein ACVJH7_000415 [Bradyrhizobium elkanii]